MRKYQIWKLSNDYAISDFGKNKIDFATHKDFTLDFQKHSVVETESASKPAFFEYIKPIITNHGVHPIYNFKGDVCEQVVNVPTRILSSEEILKYLNDYTILPQETPPWEEVIYKLSCYCPILTEEYFEKENSLSTMNELAIANLFCEEEEDTRSEDDTDKHYLVTSPKKFEERKGTIFHLPKPNRAHRKWVILDEYYDYKKNAWVTPDPKKIIKRDKPRIDLVDNKVTIITEDEISKAKKDYVAEGGKVTILEDQFDDKPEIEFDWKSLEIHHLAFLIPVMKDSDRERLKEDIRLNGVHEALWLYEGKILEGRTRYGICLEIGVKPKFKPFKGPGSARSFVMSMNIHRRHLSSSQIAAFGVEELLPEFEKEAKGRMLNGGTEKIQEGKKGEACEHIANALKTNSRYVYDAKSIKEKSPDVFKKILSGELTISAAKKQIKPDVKIKKRKTRKPFEKLYHEMLKTIMYRSESNNSISASPQIFVALKTISEIYLLWNKKNDKRVIKLLEEMKPKFDGIFGEKKKRHLHLLEM